jgi:hypothetical protein
VGGLERLDGAAKEFTTAMKGVPGNICELFAEELANRDIMYMGTWRGLSSKQRKPRLLQSLYNHICKVLWLDRI